jgi:hypothetical protein
MLVDNINMDLSEIGCEDGRWMGLAQDRMQWRTPNLGVLLPATSFHFLLTVVNMNVIHILLPTKLPVLGHGQHDLPLRSAKNAY